MKKCMCNIDRLHEALEHLSTKVADHDSAAQAHKERADFAEQELEQIRKDLKGHKDSVLAGENGLAQATMRGFEMMSKQLNVTEKALELAVADANEAWRRVYREYTTEKITPLTTNDFIQKAKEGK